MTRLDYDKEVGSCPCTSDSPCLSLPCLNVWLLSACAARAARSNSPWCPHLGMDKNASTRSLDLVFQLALLPYSYGVCISVHRHCCAWVGGLAAPPRIHFPVATAGSARCTGCCSPAALPVGPATSNRRMSEVRLPPLRALDDFALGSARLAAPDPCDPQRWCHRVINNLLYYQTNYLVCFSFGLALAG